LKSQKITALILFSLVGLLLVAKVGIAPLYVLVIPLTRISVIGTQFTVIRLILLAGVGYYFFRPIVRRDRYKKWLNSVILGLGIFAAMLFVWMPFSPDPVYARQTGISFISITLLPVMLINLSVTNKNGLRLFIITILGFGVIDALLSIFQFVFGYNSMPSFYYDIIASAQVIRIYNIYDMGNSAFGLFSERGFNSMFLVMCSYIAYANVVSSYPFPKRLAWFLLGIFSIGVLCTLNRTGAGLLVIGIILLTILFYKQKLLSQRQITAYISGIVVIGFVVSLIADTQIDTLYQRYLHAGRSWFYILTATRGYIWLDALELFFQSPLLGGGIGVTYVEMANSISPVIHNGYIEILVEMGIIGFIIWFIVLFLIARKYIQLIRQGTLFRQDAILLAFGVFFVASLIWAYTGLSWKPGWEYVSISFIMPWVFEAVYQHELRGSLTTFNPWEKISNTGVSNVRG